MTRNLSLATLAFATLCASAFGQTDKKLFLENDVIRIGVDLESGGSIFHFSRAPEHRNLLNHHDRGRFIQQSYYGDADGSKWGKQDWRWNPVQGGGYKGEPAILLDFKKTNDSLYTKSTPKHWATGQDLPDSTMEEWITLDGEVARVRYRFSYSGEHAHAARDHEMPAVFVDHALPSLVFYTGDKPWTNAELKRIVPGWPNEGHTRDEEWAAYVDAKDWGIGVYTPGSPKMTCYRYAGPDGPDGDGCSYFAPLRSMAITKGTTIDYALYLTIGPIAEIRNRFQRIRISLPAPK